MPLLVNSTSRIAVSSCAFSTSNWETSERVSCMIDVVGLVSALTNKGWTGCEDVAYAPSKSVVEGTVGGDAIDVSAEGCGKGNG